MKNPNGAVFVFDRVVERNSVVLNQQLLMESCRVSGVGCN